MKEEDAIHSLFRTKDKLFSESDMKHTPSLKVMDSKKEKDLRTDTCDFIIACCKQLQLLHSVIFTSCMYFHRFYMLHSFATENLDRHRVATACMFLASKVKEAKQPIDKLIITMFNPYGEKQKKTKIPHRKSEEFKTIRNDILKIERLVFQALNCHLKLDLPLIHLKKLLRGLKMSKEFSQKASYILNDTVKYTICIQYPAVLLAKGACLMAFLNLKKSPPPTWKMSQIELVHVIKMAKSIHECVYDGKWNIDFTPFEKIVESTSDPKSIVSLSY